MNQNLYKKELKQYFKIIKRSLLLSYSRQHTNSILQMLEQNAIIYFDENPTANFEDFKQQFGEPEHLSPDIFEMTFASVPTKTVETISYKKRSFKIIVAGVLICILLIAGFYLKAYLDCYYAEPIYHKTEITYIE